MCHQDSVLFVNCSHISTGVVPSKGKRQAAPVNAKAALLVASGATVAAFARILGFGTTVASGKALSGESFEAFLILGFLSQGFEWLIWRTFQLEEFS